MPLLSVMAILLVSSEEEEGGWEGDTAKTPRAKVKRSLRCILVNEFVVPNECFCC